MRKAYVGAKFQTYVIINEHGSMKWKKLVNNDFRSSALLAVYSMAFPVVEFSRQGYKIRKVFG